ncbi:hypothetical protein AB4Z43_17900 [Mesorhizobium sp. 2RAF45]|uniref:hypothetical protein n=1 Tax=Mesorhizobium sp. 2RAF45 TaxID=3233001 RepID=UPI003F9DC127
MDASKTEDEKKFNETLKRMLKTAPDHKVSKKTKEKGGGHKPPPKATPKNDG